MRSAERLAAALQFCGNGVVTTALDSDIPGAVRRADLAATDPYTMGGRAEQAVTWLTSTPLLRALSPGHWQFAHQGLQDFLAASYLGGRNLSSASVQSLLFVGPADNRYVHPRHRGVAGWLAMHNENLRTEMLAQDAAPLLVADLPTQPPHVRAQIVDALFTAARSGEGTGLPSWSVLHWAEHPGLGEQLTAQITPEAARLEEPERWPLALALAFCRTCPRHAPVPALLDVAEDIHVENGIRLAAVRAIPLPVAADMAQRLVALADTAPADLAAEALLAIWPQHLPTADMLVRMRAAVPAPSWMRVTSRLGVSDIDAALTWLRRHLSSDEPPATAGIIQLVTWLSMTLSPASGHMPAPRAAAMLGEAIALLLRRDADLGYEPDLSDARETWAGDAGWRRLVAHHVITRLLAEDTAALYAAMNDPLELIPPCDSIYWARQAAAATGNELGGLGDPLQLRPPSDTSELANLRAEREQDPRLADLTIRWFSPPHRFPMPDADAVAAWNRAAISDALDGLLPLRPESGQILLWWNEITQWLGRDPELRLDLVLPLRLDLTMAASCPPPGSRSRTALELAAAHVLQHAPVTTAATIGTGPTLTYPGEITALSLVESPDLTPEQWTGLALLLSFSDCGPADQDLRRRQLARAAAKAGATFAQALPTALSRASPPWVTNVITTLVGETELGEAELGDQVNRAVLGWAADPDRPMTIWRDTMRVLAFHDRDSLPVLSTLADHVLPADGDTAQTIRWAVATDLRLLHGPAETAPGMWEQILASPDRTLAWAREADNDHITGLSILAHGPVHAWPAAYRSLTPQQAGRLYDQLAQAGLVDIPRTDPRQAIRDISGPGRRGIHSRLPDAIAHQLTQAAQRELARLADAHPDHAALPNLVAAHERALSEAVRPLTLRQFDQLTTDPRSRIVHTIGDLTQVVLEALDELQRQALQPHGWSMLMWNREKQPAANGWWPTWEDNLSNLVCAFLRQHLKVNKPIINREVEIWPSGLAGARADLLVEASVPDDKDAQVLTLVIEAKGCWNDDIKTGIEKQLLTYLRPNPGWAGIFLVGYFHTDDSRTHQSYRKRHETPFAHTDQEILQSLRQQISTIDADRIMDAYVLRLPLTREAEAEHSPTP